MDVAASSRGLPWPSQAQRSSALHLCRTGFSGASPLRDSQNPAVVLAFVRAEEA
jgi:hypothetical protein